ncbi:MAG: allophanate hydrolase subunit 1 [Ilumatobacteraceae bacterium]
MGPNAALVECAPGEPGRLVLAAARAGVRPGAVGVVEVVPAAATVLVECTDTESLDRAVAVVRSITPDPADTVHTDPVEIAVRFDGDDLAEVAERVDRRVDQVVDAVTAADYEVAFCGFAPGFAYLAGLDPALHLPRRETPRTRVPSGSFAIATEYAAVYPTASPGGWHLLGSTDAVVWSLDREPPALLRPGTAVRIVREER